MDQENTVFDGSTSLADGLLMEDESKKQTGVIHFSYTIMQAALHDIEKMGLDDFMGPSLDLPAKKREDFLAMIQENADSLRKKPEHVLSRIKGKGLYASTIKELRLKMVDRELSGIPLWVVATCISGSTKSFLGKDSVEISENTWMMAIELFMMLLHPDVFVNKDDKTMWGIYFRTDEDISRLYFILYLCTLIPYFISLVNNHNDIIHGIRRDFDSAEKILGEWENLNQEMERLRKEASVAKTAAAEAEAEKRSVSTADQKEIMAIEHERDAALKRIAELETMNQALLDTISASEEDETEDTEDNEVAEPLPQKTYKYELPEEGILFLGGHPNLRKKIEQKHPGWAFHCDSRNGSIMGTSASIKHIFFWWKHASHATFKAFQSTDLTDVPMSYVTATNVERLETEMLEQYNEYLTKKEVDSEN